MAADKYPRSPNGLSLSPAQLSLGATSSAHKEITGQPARETGLAAQPSERQVGTQQPTCLNWSQEASRWPAPGLDRAFPAGLVSWLDPGPGVLAEGRMGTSGFSARHSASHPSSQPFLPGPPQLLDLCASLPSPPWHWACLSNTNSATPHAAWCSVEPGAPT